jgi:hypothetical protein
MAGVLSSGVERSTVGARPLVRVYSPRRLRRMLTDAGFVEVSTEVQHFRPEDTFIMASLRRRGWLVRRTTCDRIGLALSGMSSGVACGARGRGCRLVKRS